MRFLSCMSLSHVLRFDRMVQNELNAYWEDVRANYYAPFESGQLAGSSDVYMHEMPGGQYTNLLFQSKQLGLSGRWGAIKAAYADANQVLGDIPKVTPSSKVVGDLAQFMVSRNIGADDVRRDGGSLDLPGSVVEASPRSCASRCSRARPRSRARRAARTRTTAGRARRSRTTTSRRRPPR